PAARLALFLLEMAVLAPVLFYLWGYVQPAYSAAVAAATNALLAAEEHGGRVTTLVPAGSRIEGWSALRDDGQAANAYNADLLHFDFVLCAAIAIAFPIRGARRRALAVVSTLAALFAFHTVALLVTVENTYANVLAEVARRNYSPAEASIYTWLYRLFAHIGI